MRSKDAPLYQKIYDHLREQIRAGRYAPGDRVPSEKELIEQYGVSRITTKKALEMLTKDGLIVRMPGKGSYVSGGEAPGRSGKPTPPAARSNGALIGLVLPDFSDSYGTGLVSGVEQECSDNDRFTVLRRSNGRQDSEERIIEALVGMGVGGIVIMPVLDEHYSKRILRLVLDGFPLVFVDRHLNGITAPFAGTDNIAAAKKGADHLLDLGHTRISLVTPPASTTTLADRSEGFVRSHAERGVGIDQSLWCNEIVSTMPRMGTEENIAADVGRIRSLVKRNPDITCFFATEYNIALIIRQALNELGRRIPEDVSILCFDGPRNHVGTPLFTHLRQRETEMGAIATRLLLRQIGGEKVTEKIFLEAELVEGISTRQISRK
jgi:GntR family transcriptional regulator, arabinose operon transcriptional repressor